MKLNTDFNIYKYIFQSGKDTLVKFWDLDIRHCFKTIVTHRSEVCDLVLINDERLITGCHDNQNGYSLTNHSNISSNSSAIIGSMRNSGYQLMPQGGPALHDSIIKRIECWVNQGKQNN